MFPPTSISIISLVSGSRSACPASWESRAVSRGRLGSEKMQDSAEDFDRSTERHAPWQKPNALPRLAARKKAKSSLIYNESEEKKKREHYIFAYLRSRSGPNFGPWEFKKRVFLFRFAPSLVPLANR